MGKIYFIFLFILCTLHSFHSSQSENLVLRGKIIFDTWWMPNGKLKVHVTTGMDTLKAIRIRGSVLGIGREAVFNMNSFRKDNINELSIDGLQHVVNITLDPGFSSKEGGYVNINIQKTDTLVSERVLIDIKKRPLALVLCKDDSFVKITKCNIYYSLKENLVKKYTIK